MADVAYKNNSFQGKVEGKKVMSFGATEASFKVLAQAQPGETYEVSIVKNDKGYNDWVSMQKAGAEGAGNNGNGQGSQQTHAASSARANGAVSPARSTYETPEERAKKQVYIIRQSSFTSAVSMLGVGAKAPLNKEGVFALAKEIEAYVLGNATNNGGATGFDDLPAFDPSFDNQPQVE